MSLSFKYLSFDNVNKINLTVTFGTRHKEASCFPQARGIAWAGRETKECKLNRHGVQTV